MKKKIFKSLIAQFCTLALTAGMIVTAPVSTAAAKEQAAAAETQAPADAVTEPSVDTEAETTAIPDLKTHYSAFFFNRGWSPVKDDNTVCRAPADSYITAIKVALISQPAQMTGTLAYQVNLSGSGWLDWVENDVETGATDTAMPLESIRMKLTGSLNENYDIYYAVLQNGSWTDWAMNEAPAGTEGAGLRIDGIRTSIVAKGSAAPNMTVPGPDPSRPMVALTFDDGPNPAVTNRILNSLEANEGHATFFMVGSRVSGSQTTIQRMVALGCQVGNHTYDHKDLTKIGASGIQSQVASTTQRIADACGVAPTVTRPPYGASNASVLSVLGTMNMSSILWDIDTLDWKTRNAQSTINSVLNNVKDGDIVLMHDLYSATADAAEVIIPELTRRGYQLVTVEELARYRGGLAAGHSYSRFRP